MAHEQVLVSFYAALKGVATDSMIRVLDLAKENGISYRTLSASIKESNLELIWIGSKAYVHRDAAVELIQAS